MHFLFGLGNPGQQYQKSRHNMGFMLLERLISQFSGLSESSADKFFAKIWKNQHVLLAEPQTFMNESGRSVRAILDFYAKEDVRSGAPLHNLFVLFDDLDLEVGKFKLQFGRGPKVHNGVNSIYQHLGHDQFWHVRVGIDGRQGQRLIPPADYVLSGFSPEEKTQIDAVSDQVVSELLKKVQSSL
jgi:peptidyl-tRNA hydrolase, PTH1 family